MSTLIDGQTRSMVAEGLDVERAVAESMVEEAPSHVTRGIDPRVKAGCQALDKKHPGWAYKIDLEKFDIRSISCCIVGQLAGDYNYSNIRAITGSGLVTGTSLGFCATSDSESDWDVLQNSWVEAIKARRTRQ